MSGTTNIPGVCVIVRREDQILLILRENTGWKDGEYVVPSGHVEENESFKEAGVREVQEEVGLTIKSEDLQYLLTVHRKSIHDMRIDVYFEALVWEGEPQNMEPDKHNKVEWFSITDLPENIVDYIKSGLAAISKAEPYEEFGWD
jgi:ADP-ribose pyrophosphatase YjhB (NUDIX family)